VLSFLPPDSLVGQNFAETQGWQYRLHVVAGMACPAEKLANHDFIDWPKAPVQAGTELAM